MNSTKHELEGISKIRDAIANLLDVIDEADLKPGLSVPSSQERSDLLDIHKLYDVAFDAGKAAIRLETLYKSQQYPPPSLSLPSALPVNAGRPKSRLGSGPHTTKHHTMKKHTWKVELTISVSENWVADGIDFSQPHALEALQEAVASEFLSYAYGHEYSIKAKCTKEPSATTVRTLQGWEG